MFVLKTLVDSEIKTRFKNLAKARKLSESEFLRYIVFAVTENEMPKEQPIRIDANKVDLVKMTIRMPRFLIESTKKRAKAKGMTPSRFVRALVQSNLTVQPVMTDAELSMLNVSSRELAAIGRNINQIARTLHASFHETERVRLDKLAELSNAISDNRAAIRALVRASQSAWEADE